MPENIQKVKQVVEYEGIKYTFETDIVFIKKDGGVEIYLDNQSVVKND